MSAMASQITGVSIVCSTVGSGGDQRKHQSPASLAFVRGFHRSSVNSPHKGPVTRKMFPFDDVIMRLSATRASIANLWRQGQHCLSGAYFAKDVSILIQFLMEILLFFPSNSDELVAILFAQHSFRCMGKNVAISLQWRQMSFMTSHITGNPICCSTVCKVQSKHQSPPYFESTGGFPSQRARNAESILMSWQHYIRIPLTKGP